MKPSKVTLGFNLVVTRVLHVDGSNDPTVVLPSPTSKQIFRHSIDVTIKLHSTILEVMTQPEVSVWLFDLYKNKTLTADHKTLAMIAEELTDAIEEEFATLNVIPVSEISIAEGRMLQTFSYE